MDGEDAHDGVMVVNRLFERVTVEVIARLAKWAAYDVGVRVYEGLIECCLGH